MIIIVIHIIRCLVKGDKIMKLKEHLVARELAEIEKCTPYDEIYMSFISKKKKKGKIIIVLIGAGLV